MAMIGRPDPVKNNLSQTISMATPEQKVGDELNKVAGIKPEQRFVDRKTHETMGPDGFMKLLAHQIKNQDPMKPMDQKEFSANLAQFSQLEQMTAMNKKFDAFTGNLDNDKRFQGASYLGKKVTTSGTTINFNGDGKDVDLPFFLEKPAKNVIVHIYDKKNQMIGSINKEDIGKGQQSIVWDGIGLDGQMAPKDSYHFDIVAFDDKNEKFMGQTQAEGVVTGVTFDRGETVFTLKDGKKVFLKDVASFAINTPTTPAQSIPDAYSKVEGRK